LENASIFITTDLQSTDDVNIAEMFIPYNIFQSLSYGMMPAIVIFCLCLGFALIEDDVNRPLMGVLSILTKAFTLERDCGKLDKKRNY
jgi:Na+/H+-dicarboxylate symporter